MNRVPRFERKEHVTTQPAQPERTEVAPDWSPTSWTAKPQAQAVDYPDAAARDRAIQTLCKLPPLVTSWEIERLRSLLADAQQGKRFVLQGGDCAESFADCTSPMIANKLKILLQMSLVLIQGGKKPIVRIGRFAGQYAKPRSSTTETRSVNGHPITLPSYFGDLINRAEFSQEARTPDPELLISAYQHAALTLNFIRSLIDGGFADLHHPEYWDLSFFKRANLPVELRDEYERITRRLGDGLRFMEALAERQVADSTRAEFFTSHEALSLWYESAQTRTVPRRENMYYNLSTHLPWIGERTRDLNGAHVEYCRGIRNPVGVKLGSKTAPKDAIALAAMLNPANEPGKLVFITRMGASHVSTVLPGLVSAVRDSGRSVVWMCDPMHGNNSTTSTGIKTRSFDAILAELEASFDVHRMLNVPLGGVHFELTGEDVTECLGGASGITEADLSTNYATMCDPRLNYEQSLEMAFLLARRMGLS